jgi:hypothetical protein
MASDAGPSNSVGAMSSRTTTIPAAHIASTAETHCRSFSRPTTWTLMRRKIEP